MDVTTKRIWVHRNEVVDAVEVRDGERLRSYSYTYKYRERGSPWQPIVRWDNLGQVPHVDVYDANRTLVDQKPCRDKALKEVIKLVLAFRRNLLSMDIAQL